MASCSKIWTILLGAALALSLTACPAPTGRRRGRSSDGSAMSCSSMPYHGGYCYTVSESCMSSTYCPLTGSYTYEICYCTSGNRWSCSNSCSDGGVGPDGSASCPTRPVQQGEWCGPELSGFYCPSEYVRDCDGSWRRLYCSCTGSRWSCERPICPDGGVIDVDVPDVVDAADAPRDVDLTCPSMPAPGAPCTPGLGCWYPDEAAECRTYCNCEADGRFACVEVPCSDGGLSRDATARD